MTIYTFDVFDTLVTRRVATPRGVFVHLQQEFASQTHELPGALRENFAEERVNAEYWARVQAREKDPKAAHYIPEEIDVVDVYRWLVARHGLDESWVERFVAAELLAETRFLYGVPSMLARFRELAARGERILLLSDMYVRRQDLKQMLDAVDPCLLQHATLYLSSEIKLNKASGLMFKYVAEQEKAEASAFRHIGDNPLSDVQRPRQNGWETTFFGDCHLDSEELFERNENDLGWQVSAALFRECRLNLDSDAARVGGLYAATVLLPFVLWTVEQARRHGRRRIYFFGRDGQVLLEIARRLGAEDLELRYLYVSRLALHRCVSDDFDAFLDWVFTSYRGMSLKDIAYRITSQATECMLLLRARAALPIADDQPLSRGQMKALRKLLTSDGELRAEVLAMSAREREQVLAYLDQEGLSRVDDACVVDVGWSGTIQDSLHAILRRRYGRSLGVLMGFYWGLERHTKDESVDNVKRAFAFQPDSRWRDISTLREMVECFTAADHGSTLGYAQADGRWAPILNGEGPEVVTWGLPELRRGLHYFVDRMITLLPAERIVALMPYYLRRLEHALQKPSPAFARLMGAFPYSPDPTGKLLPFAPPLTTLQALQYQLSAGIRRGRVTRWRQGSLVNSGGWGRYLLSSKSSTLFLALKGVHPRGFVDLVPYRVRGWAKRTLPRPLIRACRALLRG